VHSALRAVGQKPGVPMDLLWKTTLDGHALGGTRVGLSPAERRERAAAAAEQRMGMGAHAPTVSSELAACGARSNSVGASHAASGQVAGASSLMSDVAAPLCALSGPDRGQVVACPCCTLHNPSCTRACVACGSALATAAKTDRPLANEVVELSDSD
jgi:hypothetical protein